MNNNPNKDDSDIDLIEKYHRGLLEGTALEEFRTREKADNAFAKKVKSYISIIEGIEYYGKQKEFADTIQEWEKEIKGRSAENKTIDGPAHESEQGVIPMHRKNMYWLAAAAVSLLIVSAVFLFRSATPDPQTLYEAFYQPYPNVFDPTVRGDPDTLSLNMNAFRAYDQGDYARAAEYFREASGAGNQTEKEINMLYLANCYLALDSADAAKSILVQIGQGSHVSDQAKWYLGLTYLKLGDAEESKRVLNELAESSGSYQSKASQLLQEIDK